MTSGLLESLNMSLYRFVQLAMEGHIMPSTSRVENMYTEAKAYRLNVYSIINSFQYYLADQIRCEKSG